MQDILRLKIPCFQPEYKRWKRYGYTDVTEKENLHKLLEDTTGGYCMYCFSRVKIDGKSHGHLEHAIEKNNSDRLSSSKYKVYLYSFLYCIKNIKTKYIRTFK